MDLGRYRDLSSKIRNSYHCVACGLDDGARRREKQACRLEEYFRSVTMTNSRQCKKRTAVLSRQNPGDCGAGRRQARTSKPHDAERIGLDETANAIIPVNECAPSPPYFGQKFLTLPDEILLMVFSESSDQDLRPVAKVFPVTNEILTQLL